ncbi:MFS transporter [Saccharopolyspora spinosporotrichia]
MFAAVLGVLAALTVPAVPGAARAPAGQGTSRAPVGRFGALLLIAISGGLGSAAANALGAFVTTTAVHVGFSPAAAGLVLALGSVAGLTIRLLAGVAADRWNPDLLRVVTAMLLVGSVGYGLMALGTPPLLLAGVAFGFGAGWAWPGLLNFAVARIAPDRVARATSFSQSGVYFGGSAGPLLFGFIAEQAGLTAAWLAAGSAAIVAAVLLLFVKR